MVKGGERSSESNSLCYCVQTSSKRWEVTIYHQVKGSTTDAQDYNSRFLEVSWGFPSGWEILSKENDVMFIVYKTSNKKSKAIFPGSKSVILHFRLLSV